ncbi:MAG: hypothetical protein LBT89_04235 [Planctomycetaceae bacterium]|jgi:hypothetical protein|nr:hypothetical protein [Planctomycetaceae bacterium]
MNSQNLQPPERFSYQEFPYQDPNTANQALGEKKRGCGCWFLGCGIGCLVLIILAAITGVLAYYYCLKGQPLLVSPETTVITEPKKKDGVSVDFFKAIQDITETKKPANDNGFKDILIGYGTAMFENKEAAQVWQHNAMCKHFNVDPLTVPQYVLTGITPDAVNHWLSVVGPGLDAVAAAVLKPDYFVPMIRQNENDLVLAVQPQTVYNFHYQLAEALRYRAKYRFAGGDYAGGWNDYVTTLRLFRRVTLNYAALESLKHGKIGGQTLLQPDDFKDIISKMPAEVRSQAVKDLETLPAWQDRSITLKTLQYGVLDILSATDDMPRLLDKFSDKPIPADIKKLLEVIGFDWNHVAVSLNEYFDEYSEKLAAAGGDLVKQQEVFNEMPPASEESIKTEIERSLNERNNNPITVSGRSALTGRMAGRIFTQIAGQMFKLQIEEEKRCKELKDSLQK